MKKFGNSLFFLPILPYEGGKMTSQIVRQHIWGSIRAAMAESGGFIEESERLRAQGYLRLMIMTDAELRELAQVLTHMPNRPTDMVYNEMKDVIAEQSEKVCEWAGHLGVV